MYFVALEKGMGRGLLRGGCDEESVRLLNLVDYLKNSFEPKYKTINPTPMLVFIAKRPRLFCWPASV